MARYIIKRLLLAVPTFFGITVVTFAIMHLAPGDPLDAPIGDSPGTTVSKKTYELLRAHFGLDEPLHVQYFSWVKGIISLDFGNSFSDHRPVWDKIRERLPWTVGLALVSLAVGLALAIPIGIHSAVKRNGWFDTGVGAFLYMLYSIPSYVVASVLLVLVVTFQMDWLPIRGAFSDNFDQMSLMQKVTDVAKHCVLITICYVYPSLAYQARFVRGNMLEVVDQDYIRTARAKGLDERTVIRKHAFRNVLIPLLTYLGLVTPAIIGGSVILEVMFNWPGIGRLFFTSIMQRDYPTVMGLSVMTALLVQLATLLADISYALVDPRVRYER